MTTAPIGHSPLGASGAERWMACPGSATLSYGVRDDDDDTFSAPGQAAHALAEGCLRSGEDAWEWIGGEYGTEAGTDVAIDKEMADAVQVYLDYVRSFTPSADRLWVEHRFHCPTLHSFFYGATDYGCLSVERRRLHTLDYKHGAGIVVEAKENPQLMYYAAGLLESEGLWGAADEVELTIVQPRGFHFDGPIRTWSITTKDLWQWVNDELVPAMDTALVSRDTESGEHCRFCPARFRACPQIVEDMEELEKMTVMLFEKDAASHLTGEQLARFVKLFEIAKIVQKAALKTVFGRLNAGSDPELAKHFKLVAAKANREWKSDAEKALVKKFGEAAYEPRTLKSPAGIEALPLGTDFTARYAFKPNKGLTVVPVEDARSAVNRDVKAMFKPLKKGEAPGN